MFMYFMLFAFVLALPQGIGDLGRLRTPIGRLDSIFFAVGGLLWAKDD
jgi:hypothetical protein